MVILPPNESFAWVIVGTEVHGVAPSLPEVIALGIASHRAGLGGSVLVALSLGWAGITAMGQVCSVGPAPVFPLPPLSLGTGLAAGGLGTYTASGCTLGNGLSEVS